jgi:hypothetical protein
VKLVPALRQPAAARVGRFELTHQERRQVRITGNRFAPPYSHFVLRAIGKALPEFLTVMEEPVAQGQYILQLGGLYLGLDVADGHWSC